MKNSDVIEIKERLTKIETLLSEKVTYIDTRVSKLEANQRWVAITVIGAVLAVILASVGIK